MALRDVKLDDKYDLGQRRVFVTGFQALVRLCLMQKELDRRNGLNTAGFVTGYRGSPLGGLDSQFHARQIVPRKERHPLPGRHQRGPCRHRGLGLATGGTARRGQVRWRFRHVVRQGSGRRPHRRRVPPRQFRRLRQARRRAGADGRRPHRRILHHRAPVRIPLHRRDDPDPEPRRRAGGARLRPLRLGDVALHRRLVGAQDDARDDRVDGGDRRQPRADQYRHPRPISAMPRGRAQYPPQRSDPGAGSAPARFQARRHARFRARQQAQPHHHLGRPRSEDRHHHHRQELSRRPPGVRRTRHRRDQMQRARHPAVTRSAAPGRSAGASLPNSPTASISSSSSRRSARCSKCRSARSFTAPPISRSASARRTSRATGCFRSRARSIPTTSRSASASGC